MDVCTDDIPDTSAPRSYGVVPFVITTVTTTATPQPAHFTRFSLQVPSARRAGPTGKAGIARSCTIFWEQKQAHENRKPCADLVQGSAVLFHLLIKFAESKDAARLLFLLFDFSLCQHAGNCG